MEPKPTLTFRPLVEADLPMLTVWLRRPHLQEWWREGDMSIDAVSEKYLPRIAGDDDARPFIALEAEKPVGYIQAYRADAGSMDFWPDEPGFGVLGVDQFLADENRLGRGLGTRMVAAFVRRLLGDPDFVAAAFDESRFLSEPVTEIRVDPRPDNARAISCYEKAGFRRVADIVTTDGPAVMMVLGPGGLTSDSVARR